MAVLLRCVFVTAMYCHGMLVSVLRRFGLIPFFLLMLIVLRLADASPAFEILDPSNIIAYSYDGQRLLLPTRLLLLDSVLDTAWVPNRCVVRKLGSPNVRVNGSQYWG